MMRFRAAWPEVHVQTREVRMGLLPGLVADGQVDIGFLRLPMALPDGLSAHVLQRDQFCLALPDDHRLAGATSSIEPGALAQESFVVPEQELGTHELGRRGGYTPRIVATPGNRLAVLTEVAMRVGIAVVPEVVSSTVLLPGVVFKPVAGEAITSELAAVFRRNERSPVVRNLIRQLAPAGEYKQNQQ